MFGGQIRLHALLPTDREDCKTGRASRKPRPDYKSRRLTRNLLMLGEARLSARKCPAERPRAPPDIRTPFAISHPSVTLLASTFNTILPICRFVPSFPCGRGASLLLRMHIAGPSPEISAPPQQRQTFSASSRLSCPLPDRLRRQGAAFTVKPLSISCKDSPLTSSLRKSDLHPKATVLASA